jgi:glycosyltransferase involved in cell wall biosynthesis
LKLLFIGGINQGNLPRGGEEYKNQLLTSKISNSLFQDIIIDTYQWQKRPSIWFKLIYHIVFRQSDSVLISASSVSTYRLLKLIKWLRPSLMKKITYLVIGGYFPEGIRDKRFDWNIYQGLKNIIVEGEMLKSNLQTHSDLENITVIPNFKNFPIINVEESKESTTFKFVYVGRISKSKGINEIIAASRKLTEHGYDFTVDLYGPIEMKTDNLQINYKGFLNFQKEPEKSYLILSEYNCMLFPTYWQGEGFPGVVIDAFVCGLPIIATDWNMNAEIIKDEVNGFIIPPMDSNALAEKMKFVMVHKDVLCGISLNNKNRANEYHIDKNWDKIKQLLQP